MLLHWYACISINTYCYEIYHISLKTVWWALSNASLIVWIRPVVYEILTNKDFTVTDGLISQLFVVTFVYPTYVQIALIWGFPVQLSLWKSVYWLWRYKLNKVCNILCYDLKTLELVKKEPCIGFTQESLIENSIQDCLPYILKGPGLC